MKFPYIDSAKNAFGFELKTKNKEQSVAAMQSHFPYIKSVKNALVLLIAAFGLQSCQEVIDVELNDADKALVVEGNLSDRNIPDTIKLSTTVNFSETNIFPAVTNAIVIISDNEGNTETLTEIAPGKYINKTLRGKAGNTYTLSIKYDGKDYAGTATIPQPVDIDTLTMEPAPFGNNNLLNITFTDPAASTNFYRVLAYKNDSFYAEQITDDRLQEGKEIKFPLFSRGRNRLSTGDTVVVYLQGIDEQVYEYFRTFQEVSGGGIQATSPANPTNNINNGALGYFNAYSVRIKTIVIK